MPSWKLSELQGWNQEDALFRKEEDRTRYGRGVKVSPCSCRHRHRVSRRGPSSFSVPSSVNGTLIAVRSASITRLPLPVSAVISSCILFDSVIIVIIEHCIPVFFAKVMSSFVSNTDTVSQNVLDRVAIRISSTSTNNHKTIDTIAVHVIVIVISISQVSISCPSSS